MISKTNRSMEKYLKAGAEMRLFKTLGARVFVDVGNLTKTADRAKLKRALDTINEICSNAEDNMFRNHPNLSHEYTSVFYGATTNPARNDVDREVLAIACKAAENLLKEDI